VHNYRWHGPYTCSDLGCPRGFPNGFGSQEELDQHRRAEHDDTVAPLSTGAYSIYGLASGVVDAGKRALSDFTGSLDRLSLNGAQSSTSQQRVDSGHIRSYDTSTTVEQLNPRKRSDLGFYLVSSNFIF
jgi:hypothetical protein